MPPSRWPWPKLRALDGGACTDQSDRRRSSLAGSRQPGESLAWIVGAGVSQPDQSYGTVLALGGAVQVDAVTGEVTVLKH